MREFRDRDGIWRVWLVVPPSDATPAVVEPFRSGWLCFEGAEGGRRWRLPVAQAPARWDEGSDIQLRQLLASARKAVKSAVTTKKAAEQRRDMEDDARG